MIVKEFLAKLGLQVDEASFAAGDAALGAMRSGLLGLGAVVSGAALAFAGLVKSTANAGDQARKLSQRVGVDSELLQGFGYAAELSDVSIEELAVGLQHLAKTGVKDTRAEVLRLADQFKKMPDGAAKTALAMEKFGRSGARLIPMLNDGAEGLAEMVAEANDFGVVIGKDDQKAAEEFNDQLTRLGKVFVGFRNRLFLGLIRPLTELVVTLRKGAFVVGEWVKKSENMSFVLTLLATGAAALAAAFVVLQREAIIAAVRSAAAWLNAAGPFIALAGVIVLVALLVDDLIHYLDNDAETAIGRFVGYWKNEFGDLQGFLTSFFAWINSLLDSVFDRFKKVGELFDRLTGMPTLSQERASLVRGVASPDARFNEKGQMISGTVLPAGASYANSVQAPVTVNITAPAEMNTQSLADKVGEVVSAEIRKAVGGLF